MFFGWCGSTWTWKTIPMSSFVSDTPSRLKRFHACLNESVPTATVDWLSRVRFLAASTALFFFHSPTHPKELLRYCHHYYCYRLIDIYELMWIIPPISRCQGPELKDTKYNRNGRIEQISLKNKNIEFII